MRLPDRRLLITGAAGIVGALVVIVVGAITGGATFAVPAAILLAIVGIAGVSAHLWAENRRSAEHDADDNVPVQPHTGRAVGDTPEAHDEITAHDIPKYNAAARHAAEHETGGDTGETIRGHQEGGAQGEGGPEEGRPERVSDAEKHGAAAFRDRDPD